MSKICRLKTYLLAALCCLCCWSCGNTSKSGSEGVSSTPSEPSASSPSTDTTKSGEQGQPAAPEPITSSSICPADSASSDELSIFDEAFHAGWDGTAYGGPSTKLDESGSACSGLVSFKMEKLKQKYAGLVLYNKTSPIALARVNMRVYVDVPMKFTLGLNFVGQKPGSHTFLSPEGSTEIIRNFSPGWQRVEGIVPETSEGTAVGAVTAIILEIQADASSDDFRIDDVRLSKKK